MPEFAYIRRALPPKELQPLRDALLGSRFVSKSTLGGTFEQSQGFAMTFKAAGRAQVEARFPLLKPYFDRVIGAPALRALQGLWPRLRKHPVAEPNCWYLNLLLVGEGGTIGRHIDTTLGREAGKPGFTPLAVTVLYLHVPQAAGGELVLSREQSIEGVIEPNEGGVLHFKGDLAHEVYPVEDLPAGAQRASLVLEQYRFDDEALARMPEFKLDSRAGFRAFLDHHAEAGVKKDFIVD